MKFKAGDRLKIVGNKSNHEFDINEEVTVTKTYYNDSNPNFRADNLVDFWWIYHESDVELIK
jgi:hypothetical protein